MPYPTLKVEIAFEVGPYATDAAIASSGGWTDVTAYVRSASVNRGRSDDFSDSFVSTATVVFDNNARRFDPFNTSSPYNGKLVPRKQIRISGLATGSYIGIFRGYVNGFPVNWSDSGFESTVTVQAFDILSLISTENIKGDLADIYTRSLSPVHYYKCNDADGSTTIKDYGSAGENLSLGSAYSNKPFSTSPPLGFGLSGNSADVTSTYYLKDNNSAVRTSGIVSVSFWGAWPSGFDGQSISIGPGSSGVDHIDFYPNNSLVGQAFVEFFNGDTSAAFTDTAKATTSAPSHYIFTYDGTSIKIYVNGVDRTGTNYTGSGGVLFPTRQVSIFGGRLQEVAMWNRVLTATERSNLYGFGSGYQTETTTDRVNRLIALSNLNAAFVSVHSSPSATIQGVPKHGSNLLEAIQEVAKSEGGFVFATKDGVLKTTNRLYHSTNANSATSQTTLTDSGSGIGYTGEVDIWQDGDNVRNDIVVTNATGNQAKTSDAVSIAANGLHNYTVDTQSWNATNLDSLAAHLLQYLGLVVPSVDSIEVGQSADTLAKWQTLLNLELLERFTFVRTPRTGSSFTQQMLINSISFDLTPKNWSMKIKGSARFAPTPPSVTMQAATSVSASTAVLNGIVSANYYSTSVVFQYSTDGSFGSGVTSVTASQSPVTGQNVAVSATASLSAGYTYYARIVATNSTASVTSGIVSFAASNAAPSVVNSAASSVVYNSAVLNGTVDANGSSTTVYFDYQTGSGSFISGYSSILATQSPVTSNTPVAVSATISLSLSTTYYWRIRATNAVGVTNVSGTSFATPAPVTPVISVLSESHVSTTALTLTGVVNAGGRSTDVYIDYKTGNNVFSVGTYTTVATSNSPISGSSPVNCSVALTGLTMGTRYYWRVRAIGTEGSATSSSTYSDCGTRATITSVTLAYGATSASATAVVNYNGLSTSASFQYSTNGGASWSSAYGAVSGITSQTYSVTGTVSGLSQNTTYLIRVSASNDLGGETLNSNSFTTHVFKWVHITGSGTWTAPDWSVNGAGGITQTSAFYGQLIAGGGGSGGSGGGGGGGGGQATTGYSVTLASSMVATIGAFGGDNSSGGSSTVTNFGVTANGGGAGNFGYYAGNPDGGTSANGNGGGAGYYAFFTGVSAGGGGGGNGGGGSSYGISGGNPVGGNAGAGSYPTYAGGFFGRGGAGHSAYGTGSYTAGGYGCGSTYGSITGSGGYAEFLYYGPSGFRSGTGWTENDY